jgi:hypothetical protein
MARKRAMAFAVKPAMAETRSWRQDGTMEETRRTVTLANAGVGAAAACGAGAGLGLFCAWSVPGAKS